MENDLEEPPKKKPRQSSLGQFGFTKNQALALAPPLLPLPPPPPPNPSLACSFCSKTFKRVNGRTCHEQFCPKNPLNTGSLEEAELRAESLLPMFDWRAWAIRYAESRGEEAVSRDEEEDSDESEEKEGGQDVPVDDPEGSKFSDVNIRNYPSMGLDKNIRFLIFAPPL